MDWIQLAQIKDQCEHGNQHLVSIKGGEFLDKLNNDQLLDKDSALLRAICYVGYFFIHKVVWVPWYSDPNGPLHDQRIHERY
jgi:hypothetical protein